MRSGAESTRWVEGSGEAEAKIEGLKQEIEGIAKELPKLINATMGSRDRITAMNREEEAIQERLQKGGRGDEERKTDEKRRVELRMELLAEGLKLTDLRKELDSAWLNIEMKKAELEVMGAELGPTIDLEKQAQEFMTEADAINRTNMKEVMTQWD